MKKNILPMLVLFTSLALSSCASSGRGKASQSVSSEEAVSSSEVSVSSSEESTSAPQPTSTESPKYAEEWSTNNTYHWHAALSGDTSDKADYAKHTLTEVTPEEDKETDPDHKAKAATCSEKGIKVEICEVCGFRKETSLSKLEHDWDNGVTSNTCGEVAKVVSTCKACGEQKEEITGFNQHTWTVTDTVEAGDGGLAYNLVKCSTCQKEGLMVAVKNADGTNNMAVTGSPKTAPEGCVKLGANGDTITAVIKLAAAKTGKLYIRGSMDYWYTESNQNEQKGIYNGKDGGAANKENGTANFTMEVGPDANNLTAVALTASKDLLYKHFFPEEVGFSSVSGTDWSQIGDVEVGNVSLAAGLNTIKFTRTDSYNIALHDFVVAFDA